LKNIFYYDPSPKKNGNLTTKENSMIFKFNVSHKDAMAANTATEFYRPSDKPPTLIVNHAELIKDLQTRESTNHISTDTNKLYVMPYMRFSNNTIAGNGDTINSKGSKSPRKSATMEELAQQARARSILNNNITRNPSIIEIESNIQKRKNTVQFEENSFGHSNRASITKSTNFFNRLSLSNQHRPNYNKIRMSVNRKDSVFFVQDEDRIFDDEKFKTSVEWLRGLQKEKKPLQLNENLTEFKYIYKTNHEGLKRIKKAQKMKNLDLDRYQKNLINNIGDYLSKESIRALESKLLSVKKMANKVKKEEAIDLLFSQVLEQNELSIKVLKESVDKLNHIRGLVKLGGERLPLIKYKNIKI
jgi:hypothetical protein